MIKLSESLYIAQGTNRACYIDPNNSNRCIKVTISKDYSESQKEIKYYRFLENQNISWEFISKYHGSIETNLGKGEIFDLIKDYDDNISKTLFYYIKKEEYSHEIPKYILLLKQLRKYTINEKIIIKDLNTKNIICQRIDKNNLKLIFIDGILNNDYLYYSNYSSFLSTKKLNKVWNTFENKTKLK